MLSQASVCSQGWGGDWVCLEWEWVSGEAWVCPEKYGYPKGVIYVRRRSGYPLILTPSGGHQNTYGWQAEVTRMMLENLLISGASLGILEKFKWLLDSP